MAALARPEFSAKSGFCATDQAGVRGKLCRALSGLMVRMDPLPDGETVKLGREGGVYYEGEFLSVTVEVPRDLPGGHLHVVYLDGSGDVLHMRPNALASETAVRGGQLVRVGAAEGERRRGLRDYRVSPPYGRGLILAVLSRHPLEPLGRRETETMGSFLASLETALRSAGSKDATVRFASAPIETRAR